MEDTGWKIHKCDGRYKKGIVPSRIEFSSCSKCDGRYRMKSLPKFTLEKTHFLFELAPAIIMEYSKPVKSLPLWLSFPDKWGISTILSLTTNNLRSFID